MDLALGVLFSKVFISENAFYFAITSLLFAANLPTDLFCQALIRSRTSIREPRPFINLAKTSSMRDAMRKIRVTNANLINWKNG